MTRPPRAGSGLTLVEMIAVLFILTLVAGIAVTATEGLVDRSKHDFTVRQLEEIRHAIVGNPSHRNSDGSPAVTGFVADMGRLPRIFVDPDPTKIGPRLLKELWEQGTLPSYSVAPLSTLPADKFDGIGGIHVGAGWRGPYLQPKGDGILDGWGLSLRVYPANETPASTYDPTRYAGSSVGVLRSWGANRAFDAGAAAGFDGDLEMVIHRSPGPPAVDLHQGVLTVNVGLKRPVPAGFVSLRLYGPTPTGTGGMLFPTSFTAASDYVKSVPAGEAGEPVVLTFSLGMQTVGPRVLCAYWTDLAPGAFDHWFHGATRRGMLNLNLAPGHNVVTVWIP